MHDNRRWFGPNGWDEVSGFRPINLEPFFEEVFTQRAMKYAFKVKKGMSWEEYDIMLANGIPEFFITREQLEEPTHMNELKVKRGGIPVDV